MRVKPKHLIVAGVLLVTGAMVASMVNTKQPGFKKTTGDVVTKIVSEAEPKASASFDIILKEGGDAKHEADHVFESVEHPAVASASFDVKTRRLEVRFDNASVTEAMIRQKLVQSGYVEPTVADAVAATMASDGKSQEIAVTVSDRLDPPLIRAKAGVPLKIVFGQGAQHLASIKIAELAVEKDLSKGGATVELTAPKPGTYEITCAEDYADGTLIVE